MFKRLLPLLLIVACSQPGPTPEPDRPADVTNLELEPLEGTVALSWVDPTVPGFLQVKVTANSKVVTVDKGVQFLWFDGLENGVEYSFLVQAVHEGGALSVGVVKKATPVAAPPAQVEGLWFALQNGLPPSVDPLVDNIEAILQIKDGGYSIYQRRHAVLPANTWAHLDEDQFYEVIRGVYSFDGERDELTFTPQKVDVLALGILSATVTESELANLDADWFVDLGPKTFAEAQSLWGTLELWPTIEAAYEVSLFSDVETDWVEYTTYDATADKLSYNVEGAHRGERWVATYLDVETDETRGGFREPRSTEAFPEELRSSLPTLPTTPRTLSQPGAAILAANPNPSQTSQGLGGLSNASILPLR